MTPSGQIREILHTKGNAVWTISPDIMVFEAIQLMAEKNVGALLVTREGQLIGILSERDYTRKVVLKGRSSKETPVREILSERVIHVTPDHTVEECMRLMTEHQGPPPPVLEGDKVAGVASIGDPAN
jgi:CBS domain-containing protein